MQPFGFFQDEGIDVGIQEKNQVGSSGRCPSREIGTDPSLTEGGPWIFPLGPTNGFDQKLTVGQAAAHPLSVDKGKVGMVAETQPSGKLSVFPTVPDNQQMTFLFQDLSHQPEGPS
jgi:hypothetical protein